MAVLTWKNVDAPNLGQAGALIESANASFGNAMKMLQDASAASTAKNNAAYSAQMLQKLAGVSDAGQVGSFLQGFDATQISPEAMQIALGQADVLQGRAAKELELANLKGDLNWEQNTRQGSLAAQSALALANEYAAAGDVQAALGVKEGLDPYALLAFNDGSTNVISSANQGQSLKENQYRFNETLEADALKDFTTNEMASGYMKYNDKEEAIRETKLRKDLTPDQRMSLLSSLEGASDDSFNVVDPNGPQGFASFGNNEAAKMQSDLIGDMEFINKNVEANLQSLPSYQFNKHLSNLSAVQGDREAGKQTGDERIEGQGFFDPVGYLRDTVGIQEGRISGSLERIVPTIQDKVEKATGLKVSAEEAAAAVAATYSHGDWRLGRSDVRVYSEDDAVELLKEMKDPKRAQEATAKELEIRSTVDGIKKSSSDVDKLLAKAQNQAAKGNTDAAEETYTQALNAQLELQEEIRKYSEEYVKKPMEEAKVKLAANAAPVVTPAAVPQQNVPAFQPGQLVGYDELGNPVMAPNYKSPLAGMFTAATPAPNVPRPLNSNNMSDVINNMTPEELMAIYR